MTSPPTFNINALPKASSSAAWSTELFQTLRNREEAELSQAVQQSRRDHEDGDVIRDPTASSSTNRNPIASSLINPDPTASSSTNATTAKQMLSQILSIMNLVRRSEPAAVSQAPVNPRTVQIIADSIHVGLESADVQEVMFPAHRLGYYRQLLGRQTWAAHTPVILTPNGGQHGDVSDRSSTGPDDWWSPSHETGWTPEQWQSWHSWEGWQEPSDSHPDQDRNLIAPMHFASLEEHAQWLCDNDTAEEEEVIALLAHSVDARSRRQTAIASTTAEAEIVALSDASFTPDPHQFQNVNAGQTPGPSPFQSPRVESSADHIRFRTQREIGDGWNSDEERPVPVLIGAASLEPGGGFFSPPRSEENSESDDSMVSIASIRQSLKVMRARRRPQKLARPTTWLSTSSLSGMQSPKNPGSSSSTVKGYSQECISTYAPNSFLRRFHRCFDLDSLL